VQSLTSKSSYTEGTLFSGVPEIGLQAMKVVKTDKRMITSKSCRSLPKVDAKETPNRIP